MNKQQLINDGLLCEGFLSDKNLEKLLKLVNCTAQKIKELRYSDTCDQYGNQYVDLVLEGGGVLGIALAGYIFMLETQNIRFAGIAGTSAGSIVALALPALGDNAHDPKSAALFRLLKDMPMHKFIDGARESRDFVNRIVVKRSKNIYKIISRGLRIVYTMKKKWGLNPGDEFKKWLMDDVFTGKYNSVESLLSRQRNLIESLRYEEKNTSDFPLVVIASDVTNGVRVRLPEMAKFYWGADWKNINPAELVRASMSVPFFFEPVKLKLDVNAINPNSWAVATGTIMDATKQSKNWLSNEAVLVDGGLMSNFPIDVFHDYKRNMPSRPTFGIKLQIDPVGNKIKKFSEYAAQQLAGARGVLDKEFIRRHHDYKELVAFIDTGNYYWLDFNLTDEARQDLFLRGAKTAADFLRGFNWDSYKNKRVNTNKAIREWGKIKPAL